LRYRLDLGIEAMHPDWFAKDTIRPVQLSTKGHDDLQQARAYQRAEELARNDDDKKVIQLVLSQGISDGHLSCRLGVQPTGSRRLQQVAPWWRSTTALRAEADKMQSTLIRCRR
jgi:predicted nucleic acid-binding Zn ribbon protein